MARTETIEYINTQEAADVLGVERTTVWRFARDGKLTKYGPAVGNSRIVRYRRDEVEALLVALNTMEPVGPAASPPARKGGRRDVVRKSATRNGNGAKR